MPCLAGVLVGPKGESIRELVEGSVKAFDADNDGMPVPVCLP